MKNQQPHNNRRLVARARNVLAWVLLEFIALQMGLAFLVGPEWDQLRDPEYDVKLTKLRERLTEFPQRPLILVLGSSRSMNGVNPKVIPLLSASEQSPMVFNFALAGVGPHQQLVVLRRLLAEGIRPAGVLSEVLPVMLYQAGHFSEDDALKRRHMQAEDLAIRKRLPINGQYPVQPQYFGWFNAWYGSRLRVLRRFAPAWIESEQLQRDFQADLNQWGWSPLGKGVKTPTAIQYQRAIADARMSYETWLAQWKISPVADRAMRELLTTCQREHMSVALYLMPEGSPFRAWYRPEVRVQLDAIWQTSVASMTSRCSMPRCGIPTKTFGTGTTCSPMGPLDSHSGSVASCSNRSQPNCAVLSFSASNQRTSGDSSDRNCLMLVVGPSCFERRP